jgi:hypothetical protein
MDLALYIYSNNTYNIRFYRLPPHVYFKLLMLLLHKVKIDDF